MCGPDAGVHLQLSGADPLGLASFGQPEVVVPVSPTQHRLRPVRRSQRQPTLAHPTRAGQRQQPGDGQQPLRLGNLPAAVHETGHLSGKIATLPRPVPDSTDPMFAGHHSDREPDPVTETDEGHAGVAVIVHGAPDTPP
ncbi:hypothetical protein GCM10018954_036820 [Kutzneria kofuensis]